MSDTQDLEIIIREARQKVWDIIIHLINNNVDMNTIIFVLNVSRWEIEELKSAKDDEAKRIAINLAKDAQELNLTAKDIEQTTRVDRVEFIKYMEEAVEINSENKKDDLCEKKNKPMIKARRITKLPDNYRSPLSKENERLLKLLRKQ
jgi:hypothetical protein